MARSLTTFFVCGAALAMGLATSARADQTHVTVTVPANGHSTPISIPIADSPVSMTCSQKVVNNVGLGSATIIRSTTDNLLVWMGYDMVTKAVSANYSATPGTHIVWCDYFSHVDVQVSSTTAIQLVSNNSTPLTVTIMFVY